MNVIKKSITLPDGREITIETGKLAKQADGSVVVSMGKTMLLATVVSRTELKDGINFLPMSVDYQEKFASSGRIPGGFLKREGRLSDYEVLISRLVDRALRPMFPDDYHLDTQINIFLISADDEALPDCLAALAASAALAVSDIPFNGPISEVRVSKHGDEYVVNPTPAVLEKSSLDLVVAATKENILMVEGSMEEVGEDEMLEALRIAHEAIKVQCDVQIELAEAVGSTEKREYATLPKDEELKKRIFDELYDKMYEVASSATANKNLRKESFTAIKQAFLETLPEDHGYDSVMLSKYLGSAEKKACRDSLLNTQIRLDGRKTEEIRQIWSEVDLLPSPHGSALFTRGETQSLTSVTLGTKLDEQMIDRAMFQGTNKFILHYNFPGFSTGEVKPNRGPGRREIGHGNLAHRALSKVVPTDLSKNPYTIRVVSDILESNGSSSMATVCAGSLALMDAGVPITGAVSGIAMGMIADPETGKYAILSDILGDEDHLGDMDFKVTGTEKGITACQMDIKIDGLPYERLKEALEQANRGRLHILGEMAKAISEPRVDYKEQTPRFQAITIDRELIGAVIGPGGKVVQEIQKESGATIVIEEVNEKGLVNIFSADKESMQDAVNRVKAIIAIPEVGEVYDGIVKSITPFGAFIEFMKGKEGLLHISEITWTRLETMDGIMEVGEEVKVKLTDVDKKTGKYRLSRKVLLPKPEGYQPSSRSGDGNRSSSSRGPRRS